MAHDSHKTRQDKTRHKHITQPSADIDNHFVLFWAVYPKKKSKGDAEKAWKVIKPDLELTNLMIDKIKRLSTTQDWLKENGQFIPYPATWLRAKGWEDDVTGAKPIPVLDATGRPPKPSDDAKWNDVKKRWEVKSDDFFGR